ncbi:DUF3152 domain-containing protein [Prauserella flavalba]|uniref:DUF3152 domain-containing protein n=1 Tax=Prauserella flavalba TaxID=1477506 RepID=A0A318LV63_9PSEU|nr:DUF3152 domain-containing protein [Prauserella flavalba]PXY37385.1 hypothetical protein BA062_06565 [Prauserella flavalba]
MDRVTHDVRRDGRRAEYPRRTSSAYRYPSRASSEDRYRPGARRVSAEPLRASWQPTAEPEESEDERPPRRSGLRRLTSTYGWRVYAIPVLLVITALVVVDTTRGNPDESGTAVGSTSDNTVDTGGAGAEGPVASENPAKAVDLNIPTAKLPEGGDFTAKGAGTWHVVPGSSDPVGTSDEVLTYTVEVEDGIDPSSYAGDDSFADTVEGTLSDPRSWTGSGEISLQRVDASYPNPDFRVSLTTPDTAHRPDICGGSIPFESSCYRRDVQGEDRVVINLARWVRGALAFSSDMTGYRQYAINHEVGHALGNGHEGCAQNDALAPVMMQQTFGVANDYVAQLNDTPGGDQGTVPADGKVCKPNAWPNPQVQGR